MRHPHILHLGDKTQGKSRLSPSPNSNEETLTPLGVQAEAWTGTERAWHLERHSLPLPMWQRKVTLTDGSATLSSAKAMFQKHNQVRRGKKISQRLKFRTLWWWATFITLGYMWPVASRLDSQYGLEAYNIKCRGPARITSIKCYYWENRAKDDLEVNSKQPG